MGWSFVLDDVDITAHAYERSWTRRLNRPSMAKCKSPSHLLSGVECGVSRLKVYDDSDVLKFHGVLWLIEEEGNRDDHWTDMTFFSPMIYWTKRYVRDVDETMVPGREQETIMERYGSGPLVMEAAINNSIDFDGPMGMYVGDVALDGIYLGARLVDWPITLDDLRTLMVNTGAVDIVETPVEDTMGNMSQVDIYNGDYGDDLHSSVIFQWGTGLRNVQKVRRKVNHDNTANAIIYYLGPRLDDDAQGDARYCGNVTRDDPCLLELFDPPQTDLLTAIDASRDLYYKLQDIRVYDGVTKEDGKCGDLQRLIANIGVAAACASAENSLRRFFQKTWQNESILRLQPRTLVWVTPEKGIPPTFDAGDRVYFEAGTQLRGGFAGTTRVYEFTADIDTEGVPELRELVTSADQETV